MVSGPKHYGGVSANTILGIAQSCEDRARKVYDVASFNTDNVIVKPSEDPYSLATVYHLPFFPNIFSIRFDNLAFKHNCVAACDSTEKCNVALIDYKIVEAEESFSFAEGLVLFAGALLGYSCNVSRTSTEVADVVDSWLFDGIENEDDTEIGLGIDVDPDSKGNETGSETDAGFERYCDKPTGFDPLVTGQTTYIDKNGIEKTFSDTCKIEGRNGMLAEGDCETYNAEDPKEGDLVKYVMCNCTEGKCVDDSVISCTDIAEANKHMDGASVWANAETGKTHVSMCNDDPNTVTWYYCNEDGTLHEDVTTCEPDILCGDGMCGGHICTDDELAGEDPQNLSKGALHFINPTTNNNFDFNDYCVFSQETHKKTTVIALECPVHTATTKDGILELLAFDSTPKSFEYLDCIEGLVCEEAVCKESTKQCVGSTDPLLDPYIKGVLFLMDTVTGYITEEVADTCVCNLAISEDGTITFLMNGLFQDHCNEDGIGSDSSFMNCAENEICSDGVCVVGTAPTEAQCHKYEDGVLNNNGDIFHSGKLYVETPCDFVRSDECTSPTSVREYTCVDNVPRLEVIECPENYFCIDVGWEYGYCGKCEDSDPTDDPFEKGEVKDVKRVTGQDFCNDDGQLMQANCDPLTGLLVWIDPENCPSGKTCSDGACK